MSWREVGFIWACCGLMISTLNDQRGFNDPALTFVGGIALLGGGLMLLYSSFFEHKE